MAFLDTCSNKPLRFVIPSFLSIAYTVKGPLVLEEAQILLDLFKFPL